MHNGYIGISSSYERLAKLEQQEGRERLQRSSGLREITSTSEARNVQATSPTEIIRKLATRAEKRIFGINSDSASEASAGEQQDTAHEEKYNPHESLLRQMEYVIAGNTKSWRTMMEREVDRTQLSKYETKELIALNKKHRNDQEEMDINLGKCAVTSNSGELVDKLHKEFIEENENYLKKSFEIILKEVRRQHNIWVKENGQQS